MRLRIKHELIEREQIVVGEDEVQVLERLGDEERLLHVVHAASAHSIHVPDARVAGARAAVRVDGERRLPGPLAVLLVACHAPQVEVGLDRLGPKDVLGAERTRLVRALHQETLRTWVWFEYI